MTLSLKPLFTLKAQVDPPQSAPNGPFGDRRFMPVSGGEFAGDRICGKILPGGADCQLIRPDGVAELDVRVMFETDDGVQILMKGLGMRHGPPEVVARLLAGETVPGSEYYFRETFFFEAPAGKYDWLNKLIGIGEGSRSAEGVELDVYEVL